MDINRINLRLILPSYAPIKICEDKCDCVLIVKFVDFFE